MTIKTAFQQLHTKLLAIYDDGEAISIAWLVLEHYTGIHRGDARLQSDYKITPLQEQQLAKALTALLTYKPVQYVLGEAWFYNMPFYVNEAVLIPRPETEELVHWIIQQQKKANQPIDIFEVGTGSGCIAIALKKQLIDATITAIDVSDAALAVAKQNASALDANITLLQTDFLKESSWLHLPEYDIIVSNPPYIPLTEKENLDVHVADWEPSTALCVPDNDPLLFYKKIALFGKMHLKKHGRIMVECHQDYAKQTAAMFNQQGYNTELRKDLFDNERMLQAWLD